MKKIIYLVLVMGIISSCGNKNANMATKTEITTATKVETSEAVKEETKTTEQEIVKPNKISPEDAKVILDSNEDIILLDVRTESEFNEGHIDGAILIPDNEISKRAEAELPDKNKKILIYCRSGRRSASASAELSKMGYTNIYDFGGINDWPYDIIK